jgi:hypothetical protein
VNTEKEQRKRSEKTRKRNKRVSMAGKEKM